MMFKRIVLFCAALLLSCAFAQIDEDDLFGGGEETGGSVFTDAQESAQESTNPVDDLLTSDRVVIGGDFGVSVEAGLGVDADGEAKLFSGLSELSMRLFLDARPARDFRAFVRGDLGYNTTSGVDFDLDELFADATVDDTVFVRAGKQTINWGVGTFFSPANLINVERIDPENPDEQLAGPVALRAQVPLGADNFTGYVLAEDLTEGAFNLGAAARYEFLVEGYEVTTGAIIEDSGHWALMATGTGALKDVTVFAEAVLEGNSDRVRVVRDESTALGLSTIPSDDLYFSGTLGGRYSYETEDERFSVSANVQYFFNGDGYSDANLFTDDPGATADLIGSGMIGPSDLQERGQHYLGVRLEFSNPNGSDSVLSALWIANLSDGSGFVDAELTYALTDEITPSVGYRYGAEGSEYYQQARRHSFAVGLDISGRF